MIPENERRFEEAISEDGLKLWQCHACGSELEWDDNTFWYLEEEGVPTLIVCSDECKQRAEEYATNQEPIGGDPAGPSEASPVKSGHGVWIHRPMTDGSSEEVTTISFKPFSFCRKYFKTVEGSYLVPTTGRTFSRQYQARRHLLKTFENDLVKTLAAVRSAMEE